MPVAFVADMPRPRFVGLGLSLLVLAAATHWHARSADPLKFDRAIREWITHPTGSARVLIRPEPGTADVVRGRLERMGRHAAVVSTSPALLVARVDKYALGSLAADPNVRRVSADAIVKSFGNAL